MKKELESYFIIPQSAVRIIRQSQLARSQKGLDKLYYIVSSLYCNQYKNFSPNYRGFLPLHSSILKRFLGNKLYTTFLRELMNIGIIERSGMYVPGQVSRGYRLKEPFRSDKAITIRIKDSKIASKKLTMRVTPEDYSSTVDRFLIKSLRNICIEYKDALKQLKIDLENKEKYTEYHFNSDFVAITDIATGQWRYSRDDFGNRAHHNLTNYRGSLKRFLKVNESEPLIGLDIANSQPFLFNIVLGKLFKEGLPSDAKKYKELTSQGMLYAYIQEHLESKHEIKQIKREFFSKVFFSRNFIGNRKNANRYTVLMENHFPNVYKAIWYCKKRGHRELPKTLQRIESYIMIETVINNLLEEKEDAFCITIHDELLTVKEDVSRVRNALEKGFSQFSLKPLIRIKKYS